MDAETKKMLEKLGDKLDQNSDKLVGIQLSVNKKIQEVKEHIYKVDKKIDLERQKTHDYLEQKKGIRENTEELIRIVSKDKTMGITNSRWATILYSVLIVLVGILGVLF